jgi:hypothetical protein
LDAEINADVERELAELGEAEFVKKYSEESC